MARPPTEFHIYCDESHTEHRFMVFGGIVIPSRDPFKPAILPHQRGARVGVSRGERASEPTPFF